MRTEEEIMNLLFGVVQNDQRIRAVGMEGSRTNPNAPKDRFQDYDVSFFITEMASFLVDDKWLNVFGDRIIMQKPEAMTLFPPALGGWFSYLMLFTDGNRIDLKLIPLADIKKYIESERGLVKVLMDKDGLFPKLAPPTDKYYNVRKPSNKEFSDCCNEFWWVSTYVAKGLARREILYAIDHLNLYVRPELLRMLSWRTGIDAGFSVSMGKNYKYMEHYIDLALWNQLLTTYDVSCYQKCWDALFMISSLFTEIAKEVAHHLGYCDPESEFLKVKDYLRQIYKEFY